MGLFSRRDKTSKASSIATSLSHASLHSNASSSIKSPTSMSIFSASRVPTGSSTHNRTSNGTTGTASSNRSRTGPPASPVSPVTPFSPVYGHSLNAAMSHVQLPRVDLPKPPDPSLDPAGYLRSLGAVRERCAVVTDKALRNKLRHFDVDMAKFPDVVSFVARIIKRDYEAPFTSIPPHGRYQHFSVGGRDRIAHLLATFSDDVDNAEKCRRIIDLFLVSVLLDAGAGTEWSFRSHENGRVYRRSEGIAVASLEMFKTGLFSSDTRNKYQVDKEGLRSLTVEKLAAGLQSKPGNIMAGMDGRANLLLRLGAALDEKKEYFGENGRPGNMLDHILSHPSTQASSMLIVPITVLWNVLMNGLAPIWPSSRTAINGVPLGDAWTCTSMPQPIPARTPSSSPTFSVFPPTPITNGASHSTAVAPWESILPFHKLTQWLTYSLMQPMQGIMQMRFAGQELLTGLPEYRNGGLFVDLGVLTLKPGDAARGLAHYADYCARTGTRAVEMAPMFDPADDVVVEWRGVTVGLLDRLTVDVNRALRNELAGHELSLAQVLEAGSWKGGREVAEVSRPNTKEPPILIDSDGTVF